MAVTTGWEVAVAGWRDAGPHGQNKVRPMEAGGGRVTGRVSSRVLPDGAWRRRHFPVTSR